MKVNEETINKAIIIVILFILGTILAIISYFLTLRLGAIAKENQTYNRYISCVLSVPPEARNQTKIDQCWTVVQKDTGVEVKRYDSENIN